MATNPIAVIQSENARLKAENEQLREELSSLREFIDALHDLMNKPTQIKRDADLMPLLRDLFQKMLGLMDATAGSLVLLDDDTDELVFVLVQGALAEDLTGYRIPASEGIAGWVVRNRTTALVRDVRHDYRFSSMIDDEFKFRTQSLVAVPLIGEGKVFGVMEALNQPGDDPFSEKDTALLGLLCRAAGDLLAKITRSGES